MKKPRLPKPRQRPSLWSVLLALGESPERADQEYFAFLREEWNAGDTSFLLSEISSSNLRPAVQALLTGIVKGKLKRPRGARISKNTEMKDMQRALRVLDLEDDGWAKRIAAESEAARQLRCSVSAVQKALGQYEDMLKAMRPEDVEWVRSFRI